MYRWFLLPALAVCAAGLVSPSLASAQTKVGVINLQRAVLETAEIKKASAEMQARYKPRQDSLEKVQRELSDIQTQLQNSVGKLSPAGQADLEAQGQRKQREATRLNEDLQADVERERNEILQRAGQRMTEVVKKVADEKELDVVVDVSTTVFFKPALEITNEAIAGYDKAYPVK
jgi:outer membrane protein